jgi:hypothetical protein
VADNNQIGRSKWPLARDIGAFLIGSFILVEQTLQPVLFGVESNTIAFVVGFACLGITGSGIAQRWLSKRMEQ